MLQNFFINRYCNSRPAIGIFLLCGLIYFSTARVTTAQVASSNQTIGKIKYYGNSFSKVFHRPHCIFAQAISCRHLIFFQFRYQAIEAHFKPCRYCLPPIELSVHGVVFIPNPASPPSQQNSVKNSAISGSTN